MSKNNHELYRNKFPRSNGYDPAWVMDNQMGPNALWLIEWISEEIELKPGMRVLDLGCGKSMTSIFMAKEFGVQVWSLDLWIHPDENWERIKEAGVDDLVYPIRVEAHSLPFARDFFDAVVSVDAYQYFGTDALYLRYISRFLKPGAKIGVAVPALTQEIGEVPEHLLKKQKNGACFWEDECICFQTAENWDKLWRRSNILSDVKVNALEDGWEYWRDFERVLEKNGKNIFPSVEEALTEDCGRYIGFIRATGTRKEDSSLMNLNDPSLISTLSEE